MSQASTAVISTPSKPNASLATSSSRSATPATPVAPSPGTFRHPRLTEIIQRQSASSLTSQRIQNAGINIVALVLTVVFANAIDRILSTSLAVAAIPSTVLDGSRSILILRVLLCLNVIVSLRPVLPYVSHQDDVSDIPLTPSQRALMGLPPSQQASPATSKGDNGVVTPPRYRRDGGTKMATSAQNSPVVFSTGGRSTSVNYSPSPLSASRYTSGFSPSPHPPNTPSTRNYRPAANSPFAVSPSGSPLSQQAVASDLNQSTFTTINGRASFGTSTSSLGFGLSRSHSTRERRSGLADADSVPGTPSPSGPKRQPGVNYKWLYDKGARLPRSESMGF